MIGRGPESKSISERFVNNNTRNSPTNFMHPKQNVINGPFCARTGEYYYYYYGKLCVYLYQNVVF